MKTISYSITANQLSSHCSGTCLYCSSARQLKSIQGVKGVSGEINNGSLLKSIEEIDEETFKTFRLDKEKLFEALDNDHQIKPILKNGKLTEEATFHADLWGGPDPVTSLTMLMEMVNALTEYCKSRGFAQYRFSTSTNGLPLIRNEACDYLQENNIHIQLSHDGLGQWMRTLDYDPMDMPNLRRLIKEGTLDAINCTLSFWNNSLFANREYWIKHLRSIFCTTNLNNLQGKDREVVQHLYLKLNHIYDGQYDIQAKNVRGLYNGKEYESLKGAPLGNMNFRNDRELAKKYGIRELGTNLTDYLHDYMHIALLMMDPFMKNDLEWKPFRSYFDGQTNRFGFIKDHDSGMGSCRQFQRYQHDLFADKSKHPEAAETFVIDTTGRYSECNLLDADHHVSNPGGVQPEYCKGCKYEFARECNYCGSEKFPLECNYSYEWETFLQEMQWISQLINNTKTDTENRMKNQIINNLFSNNNCKCKGR